MLQGRTTYMAQHAAPRTARSIFGREPAAWLGLIESGLMLLLAFGLGVSQTTFGPIMAVVVAAFGVYTAWATRDTALGAIVGLVKSGIVLGAVYGFTLTDGQTGAIVAGVTMLVSFFQRTQTSPVDAPLDPSPQQVVQSPVGQVSTVPGSDPLAERGAVNVQSGLVIAVLVLGAIALVIFIVNSL